MFGKTIVDKNVVVLKVEEKTTAVRVDKFSRNSMFSGGESYAKNVFVVTLKKETGEEFTLAASEDMTLGLKAGMMGNVTHKGNTLKHFERS